jgi:hypothetical protein
MRPVFLLGLEAACGGGGGFPDARPIDAPAPNATFSLAWTLDDASNQPLPCGRIGALSVTVLAHNQAVEGGLPQVFTCDSGMGTSQALAAGVWDFDFQLSSATGGVIATAPGQHSVTLSANQNTPLTPLTFTVDATGGLALTLASNRIDGNCAAPPGGGGIANTTITLVHAADSSCAPVTFNITGGATYLVDCATLAVAGCIDISQTLTATSVPSDTYVIHVQGMVADGTVCWTNNDSFMVPPSGQTLTKTLNLAYATGTPGCP